MVEPTFIDNSVSSFRKPELQRFPLLSFMTPGLSTQLQASFISFFFLTFKMTVNIQLILPFLTGQVIECLLLEQGRTVLLVKEPPYQCRQG